MIASHIFDRFRTSPRTILASLIAGLVVLGISSGLYLREASQVEKNQEDRESGRMKVFIRLVERDLSSGITDLNILADGDGFRDYLRTGQQSDLDRAIHRAAFLSRLEPDYDKIRYIDERGQEVIRVNSNGAVVPKEQLQNKADRPFFQITSKLAAGEIYISALDLNVENGRIERPFNPTIRFATPIYDAPGRQRGIYIINYRISNLLCRLQQFAPQYYHRLRLLNDRGYWLKGASPEQEWGFMLSERAGMTLANTDSTLWDQIAREPEGQIPYEAGLFTWDRFAPKEIESIGTKTVVTDDKYLVMASEISSTEWNDLYVGLRQTFFCVDVVLVLLVVASGWFFHSRQHAQQERDRFFVVTRDLLCIAGFDGYFKRVNEAWTKTLGYTNEELLARPFVEFIHPDDVETTRSEAGRLSRGGETISFENRYRCKDGSYRWLSWSARSLVEEQLIYASARDLTERKRIEEHILKLNKDLKDRADQLEAANKELEAFSYSVSHDLRAPLRHVDGYVDLLGRHLEPILDEKGRRYLHTISDSARQMGALIDDLLVFSRMSRTEIRCVKISMDALVREVIDAMPLETKGRRIDWKIEPLPEVEGDLAMLRQVWVNLIGNAVKYTRTRDPAEIEIRWAGANGGDPVFSIRDNGVGFDMRYADKLFGVFQRLHRAEEFEGTGIGLANVRRIITRHNGQTWAEGSPGKGAVIFFSLPKKNNKPKG